MFFRLIVATTLVMTPLFLVPSLGHAATLETPGNGDNLSGIGVIRGWKCEAVGEITVALDGGSPIAMAYGNTRPDVHNAGACPSAQVGFVSIINWGDLKDGTHTAVAYDNGAEFARTTFTVVRASAEQGFLPDVTAECTVPDFPDVGTNARFAWSTSTQHLELAEVGEDVVVPVSTQFDGEWDFVMELTDSVFEHGICECYRPPFRDAVLVEQGESFLGWYECGQEDRGTRWFPIIAPTGQVEGSFGQMDEHGRFVPYGTLEGVLYDDGTGGGRWIHIFGCAGSWSVQRREDA